MMRYLLSLCLLLTTHVVFGSCSAVSDSSHPCRYPAGDAWCQQRGYAPYAYEDKCTKYNPAPQGRGAGKSSAPNYVRIVNKSSQPLVRVFITSAGDSNWGSDQLGSDVITPGSAYKWRIPWSGCSVDIKATTAAGNTVEKFGVDACGGVIWTLY